MLVHKHYTYDGNGEVCDANMLYNALNMKPSQGMGIVQKLLKKQYPINVLPSDVCRKLVLSCFSRKVLL